MVEISADSPSAAYLVLTDTYFPGWKAFIGDLEVPILPADGAFRAIVAPPGQQKIFFRYMPVSFRMGLWITIASLLALGMLLCRKRIRQGV